MACLLQIAMGMSGLFKHRFWNTFLRYNSLAKVWFRGEQGFCMWHVFRRAGILLLGLSYLWFLSACSVLTTTQLKESDPTETSEQPPLWVTQRTHPKYPQAFYMVGVGFSDNGGNEADDAARLDLLKQIEVEIKGEESAVQTESIKSNTKSSSASSSIYVQSKVDSRVSMTISGLRIEERWVDRNHKRFYSLAVLDREEASDNLYRQLEEMKTRIDGLIRAGEEAEALRDYKTAISRYQEALGYVNSAQALISPYKVIVPPSILTPQGREEKGGGPLNGNHSFSVVEADMKTRVDRLSGKVPAASTFISWDDGIRDLILQLIRRLPAEGLLTVAVSDFREGRSGSRVPLSDFIESDIRATMAGVEGTKIVEHEQDSGFLLTGLFRVDGNILRINATIKDIITGAIYAAGKVLIDAKDIPSGDLLPYANGAASYDVAIEQVLTIENSTSPFSVKVWTDKTKLRIGDPVTFHFKAERDCFITIFDQGTSGALRVLFPNPYQKDNFILAGKIYSVPDPGAGYEIRVDGPPGIERVKAVAFLNKSQLRIDVSDRFIEIAPEDTVHIRDLTFALKKLPGEQWADGYIEMDILLPDGTDTGRPRRLKPKRPDRPVDIIGSPGVIEKESPGAIEPKQPEKPSDTIGTPGVIEKKSQ